MKTLLEDLEEAILQSLEDGKGDYDLKVHPDRIRVTTQFSRDPSRSHNGGEYYFYRRYRIAEGGVQAFDDSSCEIDTREPWIDFYPVALTSLERIARFAEKRALARWNEQTIPVCPTCGQRVAFSEEELRAISEAIDIAVKKGRGPCPTEAWARIQKKI